MKQAMSFSEGYSLVEVLIVVTLLALIMLTTTNFLYSSLSGSGKASGLAVVKQNGDHAIGVIERKIQGTKDRDVECGVAGESLILSEGDYTDTTLDDVVTLFDIASNRVQMTVTEANPFSTDPEYLTSERVIAELPVCQIEPGEEEKPDVVIFSFQLRLGDPASDRPSEVAVERFETRASTRTYN